MLKTIQWRVRPTPLVIPTSGVACSMTLVCKLLVVCHVHSTGINYQWHARSTPLTRKWHSMPLVDNFVLVGLSSSKALSTIVTHYNLHQIEKIRECTRTNHILFNHQINIKLSFITLQGTKGTQMVDHFIGHCCSCSILLVEMLLLGVSYSMIKSHISK
jgi:hypothetical protein